MSQSYKDNSGLRTAACISDNGAMFVSHMTSAPSQALCLTCS